MLNACFCVAIWFCVSSHKTPMLFPNPVPQPPSCLPQCFTRDIFPSSDTLCTYKQANVNMCGLHTPFTGTVVYYNYCSVFLFFTECFGRSFRASTKEASSFFLQPHGVPLYRFAVISQSPIGGHLICFQFFAFAVSAERQS